MHTATQFHQLDDYRAPYRITLPQPALEATLEALPAIHDEQAAIAISDVLLAVAFADHKFSRPEFDAIVAILADLMHAETLPASILSHMNEFSSEVFDMGESIRCIESMPQLSNRTLFAFAREVCDSDGSYDLEENAFMISLAHVLGLAPATCSEFGVLDTDQAYSVSKRGEDIVLALLGLVVLGIPMLLIALAIRLIHPDPCCSANTARPSGDGPSRSSSSAP